MNLTLFNNTSTGTLTDSSGVSAISPASLPLYFGDVLLLNLYLLAFPQGFAQFGSNIVQQILPAGISLFAYLDDGKIGGTIYSNVVNGVTNGFVADPTNKFFVGTLPINTQGLSDLFNGGTGPITPWLKIGYVQNNVPTTTFSGQVSINVGLPNVTLSSVPAGLTLLSSEVASATLVSKQPSNGEPLIRKTPSGKIIQIVAVDRPDGSAGIEFQQQS